jgi:hypothetical protein
MRLTLTAAALAVAFAAPCAAASPLDWPSEEQGEAMALHCAAVLSAYGHAYDFAADLVGDSGASRMGALPEPLIQQAGGADRLPEIAHLAAGFETHAESVARTSFYPTMVGDGTPYLAADGRELVVAVHTCAARFQL